ncbi:MAG TPA: hypothetical protein VFB66_21000, partial [Tepidisphaeraceae bacterium]|nr:hypothetical protein [Tepidisphaeraceae bacterium]
RGAWRYIEPRLREMLPDPAVLNYYGRDEAASPATGNYKMHQVEEQEILAHALELAGKEKASPSSGPAQAAKAAPATAGSQTPASD